MTPIAYVRGSRSSVQDDDWGDTTAVVELGDDMDMTSLDGIEEFSHAEIVYYFDQVPDEKIVTGARHPRNNTAWPRVGIFAQRGKNRPNRIGVTIVRIVRRDGRKLYVAELDAVEGTPVLDIKPVMREFLPRGEVTQPRWATELMERYWRKAPA